MPSECRNCEGRGYGESKDYDGEWRESVCRDCSGTGEVCAVDGCNHEDCEAAERAEEARERHERWLHDAYDRENDR